MKKKQLLTRVLVFLILFIVITITAFSLTLHNTLKYQIIDDYAKKGSSLASYVASYFDEPDEIQLLKMYIRTRKVDDNYIETQRKLTEIKKATELAYLYLLTVRNGKIIYLFDADNDIQTSQLGEIEKDQTYYPSINMLVEKGQFNGQYDIVDTKKYGYVVTSYAPICDSDGTVLAIVGADHYMNDVFTKLKHFIALIILETFFLFVLMGFVVYLWIKKRMVQPIVQLANTMKSFINMDEDHSAGIYSVPIKTGDEIEELAENYNTMIGRIHDYIGQLRELVAAKNRAEGELHAARAIQQGILPGVISSRDLLPHLDFSGTLLPAHEIGGDLYDTFPIDESYQVFIIGDVKGRGVPAALFMAMTQMLQRNFARSEKRPSRLAIHLNSMLAINNESHIGVSWWIGVLNVNTGDLVYTNAGHCPPVLKHGANTIEILSDQHGPMLGTDPNAIYTESDIHLADGDTLILYTNGIVDVVNCQGETWGEERLFDTIQKIEPKKQAVQNVEEILSAYSRFVQGAIPRDDATVMAIHYTADISGSLPESN